jgi:hypothetical protein
MPGAAIQAAVPRTLLNVTSGLLGILVALAGAVPAGAQEGGSGWHRMTKGTPEVRHSPNLRVVGRPFVIRYRGKRPRPGQTVTLRLLPGAPLPGSATAGDPSGAPSPGALRLVRGPATRVVPPASEPEAWSEVLTWKVVAHTPGVYPYELRTSRGTSMFALVTVVGPEATNPEPPAQSYNPPRPPPRPTPGQSEAPPRGDGPKRPAPSHNPPRRPAPGRPQLPRGGELPEAIPAAPGEASSGGATGEWEGGVAR